VRDLGESFSEKRRNFDYDKAPTSGRASGERIVDTQTLLTMYIKKKKVLGNVLNTKS
jgi:hypothetical protein